MGRRMLSKGADGIASAKCRPQEGSVCIERTGYETFLEDGRSGQSRVVPHVSALVRQAPPRMRNIGTCWAEGREDHHDLQPRPSIADRRRSEPDRPPQPVSRRTDPRMTLAVPGGRRNIMRQWHLRRPATVTSHVIRTMTCREGLSRARPLLTRSRSQDCPAAGPKVRLRRKRSRTFRKRSRRTWRSRRLGARCRGPGGRGLRLALAVPSIPGGESPRLRQRPGEDRIPDRTAGQTHHHVR
jgi:hypothetical protein